MHTPTLTWLGERSHLVGPGVDLDTNITDVVSVLHYENLRDVVLVGHSYGGMVITGAAERVGHIVYLDAANPVTASPWWLTRASGASPPARAHASWTAWSWCCSPAPSHCRTTA